MRVTAEDMLAAHRLAHRRSSARHWVAWTLAATGAALALVVREDMRPWMMLCAALLAGGELGHLLIRHVWAPRRVRRLHAQHRALHDDIDVRFDAGGLAFTTPHSDSRLPWSHVRRWYDSPEHLVLMQTDALCVVLPRRDFECSRIDELRGLLTAHVGPPASRG